jgi:hypothetical protein
MLRTADASSPKFMRGAKRSARGKACEGRLLSSRSARQICPSRPRNSPTTESFAGPPKSRNADREHPKADAQSEAERPGKACEGRLPSSRSARQICPSRPRNSPTTESFAGPPKSRTADREPKVHARREAQRSGKSTRGEAAEQPFGPSNLPVPTMKFTLTYVPLVHWLKTKSPQGEDRNPGYSRMSRR